MCVNHVLAQTVPHAARFLEGDWDGCLDINPGYCTYMWYMVCTVGIQIMFRFIVVQLTDTQQRIGCVI